MSLPAISKHLKVLERAGLISRGRDAQRRPCRLEAAPLHELSDWVATYRQFWEQRLDRLEAYLRTAQTRPQTSSKTQAPRRKRPTKGRTHAGKVR